MGAGSSSVTVNEGFLQFIVKEFNRVIKDPTRDYAVRRPRVLHATAMPTAVRTREQTVEEVLAFELPSDWPIHLSHIGVLFALDQTKSGHITPKVRSAFRSTLRRAPAWQSHGHCCGNAQDAVAFAKVCIKRLPYYRSEDQDVRRLARPRCSVTERVRAHADSTVRLLYTQAVGGHAGICGVGCDCGLVSDARTRCGAFAMTVYRLENVVRELLPVAQFDGHPGVLYAGRDAVHLLYIVRDKRCGNCYAATAACVRTVAGSHLDCHSC